MASWLPGNNLFFPELLYTVVTNPQTYVAVAVQLYVTFFSSS